MIQREYLRKLEKSPKYTQQQSNSWADYIELICLANLDQEISVKDVVDRISGRVQDLKEASEGDLEIDDDLEEEGENAPEPTRRAEKPDRYEIRVNDYFRILTVREGHYGIHYPFTVTGDIIKRKEGLDNNHKLYIYLLLCSNLYLFDKKTSGELANAFELVSFNSFKKLLPVDAVVHLFGKNPFNKDGRYSSGSFWSKILILKDDLNEHLNPSIKKKDFPSKHTGDEGLDIVGWIPTGDNLPSSLIFFAQCACTYKFAEKQHSSSYSSWNSKLIFKNPPSNSTFIPHCFRGSDGYWIKVSDIQQTFLIDRRRIIKYYEDSSVYKFDNLNVFETVETLISLREHVV